MKNNENSETPREEGAVLRTYREPCLLTAHPLLSHQTPSPPLPQGVYLHLHLRAMIQSLHFPVFESQSCRYPRRGENLAGRGGHCALHFQGDTGIARRVCSEPERDRNHRVAVSIQNTWRAVGRSPGCVHWGGSVSGHTIYLWAGKGQTFSSLHTSPTNRSRSMQAQIWPRQS